MARTFSPRDIELLGYRDPQVLEDTGGWTRLSATLDAGLSMSKTDFVYLKADCTTEQGQAISRALSASSPVYVLLAPSHKLTEQSVRSIFANKAIEVLEIEAAVWRRLSSVFATYLDALATRIPEEKFFVRARKENESRAELDRELVDYLSGKGAIPQGTVVVVSAAAGVGKTTVARRAALDLVKRLKDARVIPVFVEATHWDKFNLEANLELWDIIRNSIDHFAGSVVLTQDLFSYGLQQGYFVFIFDGFDELCSPKHSQFSPIDVLRFLADLTKQSEAKVLITTRALFWQNEIEKVGAPKNVEVLTLAPFNKQQAIGYFQQRFATSPKKREQANTLYSQLVDRSDLPENEEASARAKFANLPLVVVMLAEYVDRGGVLFAAHGQIIEELLRRLCLRDQARQDLLAGASEQLKAFEEIAVSWHDSVNPEFDLETLELVGFPKDDIKDIRHHALVTSGRSTSTLRFRWDFLAPYMRALFLRRVIGGGVTAPNEQARQIMQSEANGKGFVFEHLSGLLDATQLDRVAQAYRRTSHLQPDSRSFLLHLMLALIDADKARYGTAQDRTNALLALVNGADSLERTVNDLAIVGQIERLDLRGIRFRGCEIRDAAFVSCLVDNTTIFDECTFNGTLDLTPTEPWADVQLLSNCTVRPPASLTLDLVRSSPPTDPEELAMDAFRLGLGKFWHNGSPRNNLKRDDWKRGLLGRTKYCEPVLDALRKAGVVSESPKGQYADPRLFFSKDAFGDLQRFMDNRQLTGRIAEAFRTVLKN